MIRDLVPSGYWEVLAWVFVAVACAFAGYFFARRRPGPKSEPKAPK